MLHIYNSLTQKKQVFKPIVPGHIGLYVCGMTVYDYCHIGHARVMVVFDAITRYLRYGGFNVKYVRNITDVDDKIISRAYENNEEVNVLTARFIKALNEDTVALNILSPDHEPRVTENIAEIIQLIKTLQDKGYAYLATNGDVYYSVQRFAEYGKLSHRHLDDNLVGARVNIEEAKQNPLDFVLWKAAKNDEIQWPSPWGPGRPGWHIECSAMSKVCLGEQFDIHGGGFDLQFPHHENEIAQSEAATGCTFVNTWMHVGFVQINKEKMSKSLNNFFTIRQVLKEYPAEAVRYFLMASHYRSPINYSQESLQIAQTALQRFYLALRGLPTEEPDGNSRFHRAFQAAMDDDFNTPVALAVLFDLVREINRIREQDGHQAAKLAANLRDLANILGLLYDEPELYLQHTNQQGFSYEQLAKINQLISLRELARKEKNWVEADRLRIELSGMQVLIEDGPEGTQWRREQ